METETGDKERKNYRWVEMQQQKLSESLFKIFSIKSKNIIGNVREPSYSYEVWAFSCLLCLP